MHRVCGVVANLTPLQVTTKIPTRRLYLSGGLGLLLAAFLLFPGNPVWDLSQSRVPNTILVYGSLMLLMLAMYRDRQRYLIGFATRPRWFRRLAALAVPLGLAALLRGMDGFEPLYVRSLAREWGLIEPFTFGLYWLAIWVTVSWARLRAAQGQEAKPYDAMAVLWGLAVLEECDYLGIVGGIVGHIDGVYVGALHDLAGLWYHTGRNPWWGGGAVVLGCLLLAWVWRHGYCSGAFLQRELWSATTIPVLCGVILLLLAQLSEIDNRLLGKWDVLWCRACEETFEFFFAVLLHGSLWLKYSRDYHAMPPTMPQET